MRGVKESMIDSQLQVLKAISRNHMCSSTLQIFQALAMDSSQAKNLGQSEFGDFRAVAQRSQVVAGKNHFVKA